MDCLPKPLPVYIRLLSEGLLLKTMNPLLRPARAGLALLACTAEMPADPNEAPETPQETPDETPKAKTVAFKIDGMK